VPNISKAKVSFVEEEKGQTEKTFKKFEVPKPVAVGDIVEVTIQSVGGQGDGIAKKDGFVIFVKGAQKGETCKVKITEVKRTYAVGEKQ
jgi:predicted RNA-binding protein with TRAM domain